MAGNYAFEAVEIVDIGTGDFSSLLQGENSVSVSRFRLTLKPSMLGVDAVIHTAAPLPGRVDPTEALKVVIVVFHLQDV